MTRVDDFVIVATAADENLHGLGSATVVPTLFLEPKRDKFFNISRLPTLFATKIRSDIKKCVHFGKKNIFCPLKSVNTCKNFQNLQNSS